MKLLSRVILQINGAIDAMNKEGAGVHLPTDNNVTPAQGLVLFFLQN